MPEPVGPDAFRDWIAPYVTAVRDFTAAIDAVAERHGGLPCAASAAMSERAEEQHYRTRSEWQQPVADTHTFGAATLRAAADYARGIAELFASNHPPLYAHLTLARAALEAAVVSAWLSKPGISALERIKRGLCELLYSANEVNELRLDTSGPQNVEFWKASAQRSAGRSTPAEPSRSSTAPADRGSPTASSSSAAAPPTRGSATFSTRDCRLSITSPGSVCSPHSTPTQPDPTSGPAPRRCRRHSRAGCWRPRSRGGRPRPPRSADEQAPA